MAPGCRPGLDTPPENVRIQVHFDAGTQTSRYGEAPNPFPTYTGEDAYAERYIIRVPGLARGGEAIDEMITVCDRSTTVPPSSSPSVCQFSDSAAFSFPGTVGWKTGFRSRMAKISIRGSDLFDRGIEPH